MLDAAGESICGGEINLEACGLGKPGPCASEFDANPTSSAGAHIEIGGGERVGRTADAGGAAINQHIGDRFVAGVQSYRSSSGQFQRSRVGQNLGSCEPESAGSNVSCA